MKRYYIPPGRRIGLHRGAMIRGERVNPDTGVSEFLYTHKILKRMWIVSQGTGEFKGGWFVDEYGPGDTCDCAWANQKLQESARAG